MSHGWPATQCRDRSDLRFHWAASVARRQVSITLGREPLSGEPPPGPVAGRREDPGLVLGSSSVGFGHAVVDGQGQLLGAPTVAALALGPFEAVGTPLIERPASERVNDVLHVVAVVDPVHAEEERVQFRSQAGPAVRVPGERILAAIVQVPGRTGPCRTRCTRAQAPGAR